MEKELRWDGGWRIRNDPLGDYERIVRSNEE